MLKYVRSIHIVILWVFNKNKKYRIVRYLVEEDATTFDLVLTRSALAHGNETVHRIT